MWQDSADGRYGYRAWDRRPGDGVDPSVATDEVFNTFVIPTMFARVARGEITPEAAAAAAQKDVERIFAKWR